MDPWVSQDSRDTQGAVVAQESVQGSSLGNLDSSDSLHKPVSSSSGEPFFEDNFQPSPSQKPFAKLPDSEDYLASLEKKLAVIQKGGKKGGTATGILESLNQVRESCMVKLLSNSVTDDDSAPEFTSDEVKVNPILKKLAPEKQAISSEELVHLLKADQLALLNPEGAPKPEEESENQPELVVESEEEKE